MSLPTTTEIWRPNKSNSSMPNYTPCGFLVKNTRCLNPGCDFSHDTRRVRSWQNKHGAKPCRWGASCPHFLNGNCLYYHPPHHVQSEFNRDRAIKQDLRFVERLDVDSLVAEQEVRICDERDLASFNKISDDEIAVPGCPPRFHPITEPLSVTLDWHNPNLTPSFAKYTHTFEPLLRSIQATDPTFDVCSTADIVSNASNLRKLFHLFSNKKKLTERFDLEWRHGTLFLSKWTGDPSLRSSLGHGTGFEKETCRYAPDDHPLLQNSSSHHRVVWYSFGGLDCVIQSEVDGYYCECDHPRCDLPSVPDRPRKHEQQQQPVDINVKNGKRNRRKHTRKSSTSSSTSSTSLSRSPPTTRPLTRPKTGNSPTSSHFSRFSALLSLEDPGDTSHFITQQEQEQDQLDVLPRPSCYIAESPNDTRRGSTTSTSASTTTTSTTSTTSTSTNRRINSPSLKVHYLPGRAIPSTCLIEVKTHKASNKPMFAPEAQLYFCRRAQLSVAQHRAGVFRPSGSASASGSAPPSASNSNSLIGENKILSRGLDVASNNDNNTLKGSTSTCTTESCGAGSPATGEEDTHHSSKKSHRHTRNAGSDGACGGHNMNMNMATNGGVQDKTLDLLEWEKDNQLALGQVAAFLTLLTGKMNDLASKTEMRIACSSGRSGRVGAGLGSTRTINSGEGADAMAVKGISIVVESDGKGPGSLGSVKAGLYHQRAKNANGEDANWKSLLPDNI